jgi:hypothetical protein
MQVFSAPNAITPAIERTRALLFQPFRWSTFLKLSLVALITEGIGGNYRSSWGGGHHGHASNGGPSTISPFHLTPEWIAAIVAGSLLIIVLGCIVFYLITRLRFAFFHCLVHNTKEIRPGWRLYRMQAGRFFWLPGVVGFCFLFFVALIALPFVAGFWRVFHQGAGAGKPDFGLMLSLILLMIPIILLVVLAGFAADLILRDLMLPHYALDDATAGEAWAAVWARIRSEKGAFSLYALFRFILPIAATIAVAMVAIVPAILFALVIAALAIGIHTGMGGATGGAALLGIMAEVTVGLIALAVVVLIAICVGGPLSTGVREFALLFYGGRYQKLGDLLAPAAGAG